VTNLEVRSQKSELSEVRLKPDTTTADDGALLQFAVFDQVLTSEF